MSLLLAVIYLIFVSLGLPAKDASRVWRAIFLRWLCIYDDQCHDDHLSSVESQTDPKIAC